MKVEEQKKKKKEVAVGGHGGFATYVSIRYRKNPCGSPRRPEQKSSFSTLCLCGRRFEFEGSFWITLTRPYPLTVRVTVPNINSNQEK